MNHKITAVFAALLSSVLAAPAFAQANAYVSLKASHNQIKTDNFDYDAALGAKWAVGAQVYEHGFASLRTELEYGDTSASYSEFSGKDNGDPHSNEDRAGQLDSRTLFMNLYLDFKTGTIFTPYVMAGAGVSYAAMDYNFKSGRYSIPETRVSDWKFGWAVGAGLGAKLTDHWTLDLAYRYSDLGRFCSDAGLYLDDYSNTSTWRVKEESMKYDLTSHEVTLGVRYTF